MKVEFNVFYLLRMDNVIVRDDVLLDILVMV